MTADDMRRVFQSNEELAVWRAKSTVQRLAACDDVIEDLKARVVAAYSLRAELLWALSEGDHS